MSDAAFVEAFYKRHRDMYQYLIDADELSFATDLNTTFGRSLVLAIASYFEHEIIALLREVPARHAAGNLIIASMVEKQVIARKYHTYFDWDELKAGSFFALFGEDVKESIKAQLKTDANVKKAMEAFLELGQIRNRLVHQNYVQYDVPKTPEELIDKFRLALLFVTFLRQHLFTPSDPLVPEVEVSA